MPRSIESGSGKEFILERSVGDGVGDFIICVVGGVVLCTVGEGVGRVGWIIFRDERTRL